jgi:hypothetical protein
LFQHGYPSAGQGQLSGAGGADRPASDDYNIME